MAQNIRHRIAGDRARAGFFAFLASLPGLALAGGMAFLIAAALLDAEPGEETSAFLTGALLSVFVLLFLLIARWSYDSAHATATPQRIQAMWLRRFQSERGNSFRPSRIIDRLSRHGISALTLQDRDVQLSFEQRRNRLAPIFWLLFTPIAAGAAYFGISSWQSAQTDILDMPQAQSLQEGIGQVFAAFISMFVVLLLIIVIVFAAILISVLVIMLIAALAGPIGALFSRNRDDFQRLPHLMRAIMAGKRKRGAVVLRISDAHWREAVSTSLKAADVAIIDLSSVTEHIVWEIGEAVSGCGADGLVFICRDTGIQALPQDAVAHVRSVIGKAPTGVVFYPATRQRDGKSFAHALREAIYAAAERKVAA